MNEQSQKNTINALYATLIVSTVLSFVPSGMAQLFSLALLLLTLTAAYIYKAKDREDGLLYNHMTYLIGTIWIGTTFILLGMIVAGLWVYMKGDQSVIHAAMESVSNGTMPSEEYIQSVMNDYVAANRGLIFLASAVGIGPAIVYFVYRVVNGLSRAAKGYRLAKPKSWL